LGAVIGCSHGHFNAGRDGALIFALAGVSRGMLTGAWHRRNPDGDLGAGRTAS